MKDYISYFKYIYLDNTFYFYFGIILLSIIFWVLINEILEKTFNIGISDNDITLFSIITIVFFSIIIDNYWHVSSSFIQKISADKIKCNTFIDLGNNDYIGNVCNGKKSIIFSYGEDFFKMKLPPLPEKLDEQKFKKGLLLLSKELDIPIVKKEIMNTTMSIDYDENNNTILTLYLKSTKYSFNIFKEFFKRNHFSTINSCDKVSDFYFPSGLLGNKIYYYYDFHCKRSVFVSKNRHLAIYNNGQHLSLLLNIPNLYYKEIVNKYKNNEDSLKDFLYKRFLKNGDFLKLNIKISSVKIKNSRLIVVLFKNDGFDKDEIKNILEYFIDRPGVKDETN